MRRLVWRFNTEDPWVTYGVNRMNFGDRPATTELEVVKRKVADIGEAIDPAAAMMIKKGYSDDGVAGGTKKDVTLLMGKCYDDEKDEYVYEGTIAQIVKKGGFRIKFMMSSGETRPRILEEFNGYVLGLPWKPENNLISMHMGVNLSAKEQKVRLGDETTLEKRLRPEAESGGPYDVSTSAPATTSTCATTNASVQAFADDPDIASDR